MNFTFQPGAHNLSDPLHGPVRNWSYSSLTKFETCPYAIQLQRIERFSEPPSEAGDRGSRIHTNLENYTRGVIQSLTNVEAGKRPSIELMDRLRAAYAEGQVECEQEWTFNEDWEPVEPRTETVWAIIKLDAFLRESLTSAVVIDHKSGKSWGKDIAHADQGMIYAIGALLRYPELEYVDVKFHYVDEGKVVDKNGWKREDLAVFLPRLSKRARRLTTAKLFPPRPSKQNCRFCKFKKEVLRPDGTPACIWGVLE